MKEIKSYIGTSSVGLRFIIGVVIIFCASFSIISGTFTAVIPCVLALIPFLLIVIRGNRNNKDFYEILNTLYNTPELQEELIKDFHEAEELWGKTVLIGKKNIYIRGNCMLPKEEVEGFEYYYRPGGIRSSPTWTIHYVSRIDKKRHYITTVFPRTHSEKYVIDEVNKSNELLRNE